MREHLDVARYCSAVSCVGLAQAAIIQVQSNPTIEAEVERQKRLNAVVEAARSICQEEIVAGNCIRLRDALAALGEK